MGVTSSKKEIWTMGTYSLLTLSIMVGFMYLNTFATEVLLIPATTLATALLVAKVIDFIVSLFCGAIIEKVKIGSKGKNQSWFYVGRWILAVTIMLEVCNTSAAPLVVRIAILAVSYTVLNSLMNVVQTAYYGLVAAVAGPNMANRNAMTVNMTRQMTVVTIVCAFIPTLVTVLPFGNWNYFIVALVFMIPMPIALGKMADLAEGKDMPASGAGGGVTVSAMLGTLVKNPQLMILFIAQTVMWIAQYTYQANYTYYFIYVVGNFSMMTVVNLISAVAGFVAAMIMPRFGAKMGKKGACVFGWALMGISMVVLALFAANSLIIYTVCICVFMVGSYTYTPYYVTMYLDCGEWYLNKTGQDTRMIAAGLASPPIKIGMAAGGSLGLYLLGATGYVAGFTPDATWVSSFMNATFMLPGIIYIVAAAILLIAYKIKDADAEKYAKENAARMNAQ